MLEINSSYDNVAMGIDVIRIRCYRRGRIENLIILDVLSGRIPDSADNVRHTVFATVFQDGSVGCRIGCSLEVRLGHHQVTNINGECHHCAQNNEEQRSKDHDNPSSLISA